MTNLPKSLQKKRDSLLTKGPCLIPSTDSKCALTCHENDYCDCDMKKAFDACYEHLAPLIQEMREALICLYEDTKSEHGIDEHDILKDSSSLGMSKVAIESYNKIFGEK